MKLLFNFLIFFLALSSLTSCDKEELNISGHIRFDNMAVGQQSKYVLYTSRTPWADTDTAYKAAGDTVTLTLVSQSDLGFKVKEERKNAPNETYYYYFKIQNDSLKVIPAKDTTVESHLFFNAPKAYVLKNNNFSTLKANRWTVLELQGVEKGIGVLASATVLGQKYNAPFITYNTLAMVYDGPGVTQVYNNSNGFLCFQSLGGFAPFGNIFYLVP